MDEVKKLNPYVNIAIHQSRLDPIAEKEDLWEGIDLIISTSDEHSQQELLKSLVIWHEKPLFATTSCGIRGICSTVLPGNSEMSDYSSTFIPKLDGTDFWFHPDSFEHCVLWAIESYAELIEKSMESLSALSSNKELFLHTHEKKSEDPIRQMIMVI